MARPAEPWKWEARGGWYAWVKGKRVRLASFKEGVTRAKAELRKLLAEAEAAAGDGPALLVGDLVVRRLEALMARRDSGTGGRQTKADAERRLAGFADMHGDRPALEIKPHHVDEWLATKPGWNRTSRHDGAGAVVSVFRWALRKGLIDRNPLDGIEKPKRAKRREAVPTPGDVQALFAAGMTAELRDLLSFVFETGCRPIEARTLEARLLDRQNGLAVLTEHKTAGKTERPRVIYLSDRAKEIAFRLADLRPEGPVFRNTAGRPWTHNALGLAVRRLRARAGLPDSVVAYALRHNYATDALAMQVPAALVAEMLGHADLRMLATYSHLSERTAPLTEAAKKVRGGGGG